jgi:membrane-bound serine protease (ClpP class)
MEPMNLYITLLVSGCILIGAEIFIPGGILGILGAVVWLVAAGVGWHQFDAPWNSLSAFSLLLLLILTFVGWMRFFPKSRMGRGLMLNEHLADSHSSTSPQIAIGTRGTTISALRPSGMALLDGKRVDVISTSDWIEAEKPVKVISLQHAKVVVKACDETDA